MKTALITGTSSGIGLATAKHLAHSGYRVFAGVRSPETATDLQSAIAEGLPIEAVPLDVDSDASVAAGVAGVLEKASGLDVLVNNAGVGGGGPIEMLPIEMCKQVMETNYFGALRMMQAVLPQMRERRSGTVVNVTSLAGRLTGPCQGHYSASKWALEAASEALAAEVRPFGIRVVIIEPGVVATPIFSKGTPPADLEHMPYAQPLQRLMRFFQAQLSNPTQPDAVAVAIQRAIESASPQLRYPVGNDADLMLKWRRSMSDEEWTSLGLLSDDEFFAKAAREIGFDLYNTSANASEAGVTRPS